MKTFAPISFWFRIAFFFLLRSGRSTLVLSLMVVVAVSCLIFLSALAVGVNDTMIRNSVGLFSGHISGSNLPASLPLQALQVKGTKFVLKRIFVPGTLSHGETREGVNMVGVDPDMEMKATVLWRKTVEGRYPRRGELSVFLSTALATRLGVRSGNTVEFVSEPGRPPVPLVVAGLYRTGIEGLDRGVAFCPMGVWLGKAKTWHAAVFVEDGVEPEQVIQEYGGNLAPQAHFRSWKQTMPDLLELIDLNYLSMSIVMVLVFGVVSLGIACAFIIFIFKNLREYGIMKAMGVSPGELSLLIVLEVVLMNLAACGAGILGGLLVVLGFSQSGIDLAAFTAHNRYFLVSAVVFPRITTYSLVAPPALSFVFGLLSAMWPVLLVRGKKAVDILRVV